MRKRIRKTLVIVVALSALLVVPAAPASASTTMELTGVGNLVDECGGETSLFTMELVGDVSGCLYTTGYEGIFHPNNVYRERGTEHLVVCLNTGGDPLCGSFDTTYLFQAGFSDAGEQLYGGCDHPIVEGTATDDLEGATGKLVFVDDLEAGTFGFRARVTLP